MDNLMTLVSDLNKEFNNFIIGELEKRGIYGFVVSHGNILLNFSNKEEMNLKELSKSIGKSPQTMTTLVRKLEKQGYLHLTVNPNDKRNKLVRLTEQGKAFLPIINEISVDLYEKQYLGINQLDKDVFKTVLKNMILNFKDL